MWKVQKGITQVQLMIVVVVIGVLVAVIIPTYQGWGKGPLVQEVKIN